MEIHKALNPEIQMVKIVIPSEEITRLKPRNIVYMLFQMRLAYTYHWLSDQGMNCEAVEYIENNGNPNFDMRAGMRIVGVFGDHILDNTEGSNTEIKLTVPSINSPVVMDKFLETLKRCWDNS